MSDIWEVWVRDMDGWKLDRRTTFRDDKMCADVDPEEVRINPAPVMTAEAWVESEETEK